MTANRWTTLCRFSVVAAALSGLLSASTVRADDDAVSPALQSMMNALHETYIECLAEAAGKVDDGKAETFTIAAAIKGACTQQSDRAARALANILKDRVAEGEDPFLTAKRVIEDSYVKDSTKAILKERTSKKP
jgi:hypothetical protein